MRELWETLENQNERYNSKIINPHCIGIEIENNKVSLLIDNTLEEKELKHYKERFSKIRIYRSLKEKIKEEELGKIFL